MFVVFDLDDTLYLEVEFVRSGFDAVDAWLSRELRLNGFAAEAWRLFGDGRRGDIFDAALQTLGAPAGAGLIRKLVKVYRGHTPAIELAPDAVRIFARRADFYGFAILTDGCEDAQRRKIDVLGLVSCCDLIVPTDQWGRDYWKPHPRGFAAVQEYFSAPSSSLAYIADNPAKDFLAPKALGWKTIRIRREGGLHSRVEAELTHDADLGITDLDEMSSGDVRRYLTA
jgi:putative hydrolase of the HAD superfamily